MIPDKIPYHHFTNSVWECCRNVATTTTKSITSPLASQKWYSMYTNSMIHSNDVRIETLGFYSWLLVLINYRLIIHKAHRYKVMESIKLYNFHHACWHGGSVYPLMAPGVHVVEACAPIRKSCLRCKNTPVSNRRELLVLREHIWFNRLTTISTETIEDGYSCGDTGSFNAGFSEPHLCRR